MNLRLSEEQELLRESFEELFAAESSPERVRAAEPLGFDAGLWKQLVETGAAFMRVPEALGGSDAGLLDAALVCELAGRHLASAPLAESIAATRLLAAIPGEAARAALERSDPAQRIAVGRLDLHHVGAEVGENAARHRRGLAGEIDDADTVEKSLAHARTLLRAGRRYRI